MINNVFLFHCLSWREHINAAGSISRFADQWTHTIPCGVPPGNLWVISAGSLDFNCHSYSLRSGFVLLIAGGGDFDLQLIRAFFQAFPDRDFTGLFADGEYLAVFLIIGFHFLLGFAGFGGIYGDLLVGLLALCLLDGQCFADLDGPGLFLQLAVLDGHFLCFDGHRLRFPDLFHVALIIAVMPCPIGSQSSELTSMSAVCLKYTSRKLSSSLMASAMARNCFSFSMR